MSYATVYAASTDMQLTNRVQAAMAQEGWAEPKDDIGAMMWNIAKASDIEAAYASALAANNPNPGGDETVVTDGMILGVVQAHPQTP
jgi:hypothetical protein